jgi:hypothetical protein
MHQLVLDATGLSLGGAPMAAHGEGIQASRVRPKRLFINSDEAPCGISGLSW